MPEEDKPETIEKASSANLQYHIRIHRYGFF